MENMTNWLQINILTAPDGMEIVTGLLDAHGLHETEWVESAAQVQAFLDAHKEEWDYIDASVLLDHPPCVRAYVRDNALGRETVARLREALEAMRQSSGAALFGPLELRVIPMREEDWANNWKQFFHPFALGQRLFIRPPWEKTPAPDSRRALTIDPGMLFGTGAHPTTQLCLTALERSLTPGMRVLDAGCGSGILSIAALLLGASHVTGVDIDPHAPKTVLDNAAHNDIDPAQLHVLAGNILSDAALLRTLAETPYDLIVANIVADVILPLIPLAAPLLRNRGVLLVSGIIDDRADEVHRALLEHGFSAVREEAQGDWRLFEARAPQ